jgi:hypothetical protein
MARSNARAYLEGLLAPVERKNSWRLAEAVGDQAPYPLQHLLERATWGEDALVPPSVPEVRHLLFWLRRRPSRDPDDVLRWSWWRRHRHAVARRCHDKRRGAKPP